MSSATIYLTNECNLRCKHCFVGHDQLSKRPVLSTAEIISIVSNFAENGIKQITLLGGEVTTERSDLLQIAEHCERLEVYLSINTNLIELAPMEKILPIKALRNIVVSLDGMSSATHDRIRGKGSFEKTTRNLGILCEHPRVKDGSITLDTTFVLTAINKNDIFAIPELYRRYGISKLNFKTLQFNDRADANRHELQLTEKELLDVCTTFYVLCLMQGGITFDMHIPPAFGAYLNAIVATPERLWNFESCGGTKVYTYVDLYGNNLPCPAMSYEENRNTTLRARSPDLSAITNSIKSIHDRSLFKGFDRSIEKKHRNAAMFPCRSCKFSDRCSPCTNEIIRGSPEGRVDICAAVFKHGNDRVEGIAESLFNGHRESAALTS